VTERILLVRRLAAGRLVDELALRRLVHDAGVDPASRRGRAVVLEVAEGGDRLALLVLELAVGARDVLGRVAVDLLEDQLHLRMIRMLAVCEVRGEEALVARLLRGRVELLEPVGQRADELGDGLNVSRRLDVRLVPLDESRWVRERSVL